MSIASLPMYNLPEMRPALDRLWRAIAERLEYDGLPAVPERLMHGRPLAELWSDPALFLSQCCGNDIVYGYAGRLQPIAAPRYSAPGCVGGEYVSVVVVADHDTGGPAPLAAGSSGKDLEIRFLTDTHTALLVPVLVTGGPARDWARQRHLKDLGSAMREWLLEEKP